MAQKLSSLPNLREISFPDLRGAACFVREGGLPEHPVIVIGQVKPLTTMVLGRDSVLKLRAALTNWLANGSVNTIP